MKKRTFLRLSITLVFVVVGAYFLHQAQLLSIQIAQWKFMQLYPNFYTNLIGGFLSIEEVQSHINMLETLQLEERILGLAALVIGVIIGIFGLREKDITQPLEPRKYPSKTDEGLVA